jgi:hypothetical protein
LYGNCFSAGGFLYTGVAAAPLEFAALQGAAPLEASSTIVWLLLLWSPLLYRRQLAGDFLYRVAAAPLESAALQGAARWRLPLSSGCCSSGVRCSTGGCSLEASSIEWLLLLWSPLIYRAQGAAPPEASSAIAWLLLLWVHCSI